MANTHSIDLEASSTQYLSIADVSQTGLDLTTSDFTMEMWIKTESDPGASYFGLIGKKASSASGGGYRWIWGSSTERFELIVGNGTGDTGVNMNQSLSIGTWYHVVWTYQASDGATEIWLATQGGSHSSVGTDTLETGGCADSSAIFSIGYDARAGFYPFDGLIDEVRIWNDIRTEAELNDNFELELVGDEAGLVSYWKLNNSLVDENANANNLTNNNSATFSTNVPFGTSTSKGRVIFI